MTEPNGMPHWELYEDLVRHGARYSDLHDAIVAIQVAARAEAMRELLAATAEWRSGTMGRSYHDSLEDVVQQLLAAPNEEQP